MGPQAGGRAPETVQQICREPEKQGRRRRLPCKTEISFIKSEDVRVWRRWPAEEGREAREALQSALERLLPANLYNEGENLTL